MKKLLWFLVGGFWFLTYSNHLHAQWVQTNGPCSASILSMAVSGNEFYVGTGGGGLFRSTDGGVSFSYANGDLAYNTINSIDIGTFGLIVGTGGSGVWISTNHGINWTTGISGITNGNISSVATLGSFIFAANSGDGVLRSSDNGVTWNKVNTGITSLNVNKLYVEGTKLYAATSGAGLFVSDNSGNSWTALSTSLSNKDVKAFKSNGSRLFIGNSSGVYYSDNNGTSWIASSPNIGKAVNAIEIAGSSIFAATSGGGCFRSDNNGLTWSAMNTTNGIFNLNGNVLVKTGSAIYYASGGGGLYKSTDNGSNWVLNNNGITSSSVRTIYRNSGVLYAGVYGGGIFTSTDDGNSWSPANTGNASTDIVSFTSVGNTVFAGASGTTGQAGIYYTTNNGALWTQCLTNKSIYKLKTITDQSGAYKIFACAGDGLYYSVNNGSSWTKNASTPSASTVAIGFDKGIGLIANYSNSRPYITTDYGNTWSQVASALPYAYISSFEIIGNTIIAGTGNGMWGSGVYKSTDFGATWTDANAGLPQYLCVNSMVKIRDSVSSQAAANMNKQGSLNKTAAPPVEYEKVVVGTQGDGFYVLKVPGSGSWTQVNDGLKAHGTTIYSLFHYDVPYDEDKLMAGTFSTGVVKRRISDIDDKYYREFEVKVSSADINMGTVSGGGFYKFMEKAQIAAYPKPGFVFQQWKNYDSYSNAQQQFEESVTCNRNYVAYFTPEKVNISLAANPTNGGTVTGGGYVSYAYDVTVVATANTGFRFTHWSEGKDTVSKSASYKFIAFKDRELVANFISTRCTITTRVEPPNTGRISDGGVFELDSKVNMWAVPNYGYRLDKITYNGVELDGYSEDRTFTVKGSGEIVAYFVPAGFKITTAPEPYYAGKTEGGGDYCRYKSVIYLKAHPAEWYELVKWTENGEDVSHDTIFPYTVKGPSHLIAVFAKKKFEINTFSHPLNYGKPIGDGVFEALAKVTLKARPYPGYQFTNWTENGRVVSEDSVYIFYAEENRNIVCNYDIEQFYINVSHSPFEGGSSLGGGYFFWGDLCTLEAKAKDGYRFYGWYAKDSTLVSTDPNYTFTVMKSLDLTGKFVELKEVRLAPDPLNGGLVYGAGKFDKGSTVTIEAIANTGFAFLQWTDEAGSVYKDASLSFTINTDKNFIAHFGKGSLKVTTSASPASGGKTTGDGDYNYGSKATVTATPETGYTFICWADTGKVITTELSYTFDVLTDVHLIAVFKQQGQYAVSTSSNPYEGGTTSGGGSFPAGAGVSVKAVPYPGYTFVKWTENGEIKSTVETYNFYVASNRYLVAHFKKEGSYTIATSSSPDSGGVTSGGGIYCPGDTVTVIAIPNADYAFAGWKEFGTVVSKSLKYTFVATANRTLVAGFPKASVFISTSGSPVKSGQTWGGGPYRYGWKVKVIASPNPGNRFVSWTENGNVQSLDSIYYFDAERDRNLVANFSVMLCRINTSAVPLNMGKTTGDTTVNYGSVVKVTATANPGFAFVEWKENNNSVSNKNVYSFVADRDYNLAANFKIAQITITTSSMPLIGGVTGGGGVFAPQANVALWATANPGFVFASWTENGAVQSQQPNYGFAATVDRNLVANFAYAKYNVVTSSNPKDAGTTTGDGIYNFGDSVKVKATAKSGYIFSNWTESSVEASKNYLYAFKIASDRTLVANFVSTTSVKKEEGLPENYSISQNFPNPFNPVTRIQFSLPREGHVLLTVYNLIGEKITDLISEQLPAGVYSTSFDGSGLPNGIYIYKISSSNFTQTRKMILMK